MPKVYYGRHSHLTVSFGPCMFSPACLYTSFLMILKETNTASKMSLSKSSSESSVEDNLYFTSIGSTGSRLYSNLKGEFFFRGVFTGTISKKHYLSYKWLFQWVFFQHLHKIIIIILFCLTTKLLDKHLQLAIEHLQEHEAHQTSRWGSKATMSAHHLVQKLDNSWSCFVRYLLCLWPLT